MFAKLFSRITESSLMEEPLEVRYVFMMMLAMCDPTGHVIGTDIAVARRMNISEDEFRKCAESLMAPDPDSNSKEEDGKRITLSKGERGYFVVNYLTYRDMKTEIHKRDYMREYMRKRREAKALEEGKPAVKRVSSKLASVKHVEEDGDLEVPPKAPNGAAAAPPLGDGKKEPDVIPKSTEAIAICKLFNRRPSTEWDTKHVRKFKDGVRRGVITIENIGKIQSYYESERPKGEEGRHRRDIGTFVNNFDGELDRAEAYLSANGSHKNGNGTKDDPLWLEFLESLNRPGEWTMKTAPDYLHGDFRKWKEAKAA